MGPSFLVIGAQKAGTTWLHQKLAQHPELWLPPEKELHYWDEKRARSGSFPGVLFRRDELARRWRRQAKRRMRQRRNKNSGDTPLSWDLRYFLGRPSDRWYLRLFTPADGRIAGEVTPDYAALDRTTIQAIHLLVPDVRLILLLRNPIERAWSAAQMKARMLQSDLREVMLDDRSRELTDYIATIDAWTAVFPTEQLFVGYTEEIGIAPKRLYSSVLDFLGAEDSAFAPRGLGSLVHSGGKESMPAREAVALARNLLPLVREIDDRLDTWVTNWWSWSAQRLSDVSQHPEELVYPLWQSSLFEDWVLETGLDPRGRPVPPLQSAPLTSR